MNKLNNNLLGQIFFISIPNTIIDNDTRQLLKTIQPGGIILFKHNIESIQQIKELNHEINKILKVKPYIAIDEEGNAIHRLEKLIPPLPSPQSLALKANPMIAEKLHLSLAAILQYLGINLNFYPVVDIYYNNTIMGNRCLSADKNTVIKFVKKIIDAYNKKNIFYCFKHFPGLGNTTIDSHKSLPICNLSFKKLWNNDLFPYRKFINQIPFIMIAHCTYSKLTKDLISSLSKDIITKLLKQKLQYKGQIITDDLSMKAISDKIKIPYACIKAIKAGCHFVMICHNYNDIINSWELINKKINEDKKLHQIISNNLNVIFSFKKKLVDNKNKIKLQEFQKSITILEKIYNVIEKK